MHFPPVSPQFLQHLARTHSTYWLLCKDLGWWSLKVIKWLFKAIEKHPTTHKVCISTLLGPRVIQWLCVKKIIKCFFKTMTQRKTFGLTWQLANYYLMHESKFFYIFYKSFSNLMFSDHLHRTFGKNSCHSFHNNVCLAIPAKDEFLKFKPYLKKNIVWAQTSSDAHWTVPSCSSCHPEMQLKQWGWSCAFTDRISLYFNYITEGNSKLLSVTK